MEKRLKIGEVIWAKIRGFPWWPGMIGKIEEGNHHAQETKILVNFIGDPTHAEIPISKIEKFDKRYEEFSKTKKRRLLNSIILAKKIVKGEIQFNNHMNTQINANGNINSNHHDDDSKDKDDKDDKEDLKIVYTSNTGSTGSTVNTGSNLNIGNTIAKKKLLNKKTARKVSTSIDDKDRRNSYYNTGSRFKRSKIIVDEAEDEDESDNEDVDSEDSEEISEEEKMENNLKARIKELLFFKIELPSSTSNKSIILTLDEIHNIVTKINNPNLHELIPDLTQYLICLSTNRNQTVASKALLLTNLIQEKILADVFNPSDWPAKFKDFTVDWEDKNTNNKSSSIELSALLSTINKPTVEPQSFLSSRSNNKRKDPIAKRKTRIDSFTKLEKERDRERERENSNINLTITNNEEEENSLSEMSLITDKTDCEDLKFTHKQRIAVFPLEKKHIFSILKNYFEEFNCGDEDEFHDGLTNGQVFSCTYSFETHTRKLIKPEIKCHYMRRRVCYKLFKLKNLNIENETIKKLSIFLEMRARDGDPEMADKYKHFISNIFVKIKEHLIMSNIPLVMNELQI